MALLTASRPFPPLSCSVLTSNTITTSPPARPPPSPTRSRSVDRSPPSFSATNRNPPPQCSSLPHPRHSPQSPERRCRRPRASSASHSHPSRTSATAATPRPSSSP
uniref:Uncharacterized protein n=1 Tax=Setaria viridis TaxID=4556 RepID=A0A4U6V1T4_SETVI|nr:hypothetical protein SEVIR_4G265001v2 [Setaria viridis]